MQEEVRLSVVIPGFRTSEAWWGRSVGSVLAAVDDRDEVICVDDGEGWTFWIDFVGGGVACCISAGVCFLVLFSAAQRETLINAVKRHPVVARVLGGRSLRP